MFNYKIGHEIFFLFFVNSLTTIKVSFYVNCERFEIVVYFDKVLLRKQVIYVKENIQISFIIIYKCQIIVKTDLHLSPIFITCQN